MRSAPRYYCRATWKDCKARPDRLIKQAREGSPAASQLISTPAIHILLGITFTAAHSKKDFWRGSWDTNRGATAGLCPTNWLVNTHPMSCEGWLFPGSCPMNQLVNIHSPVRVPLTGLISCIPLVSKKTAPAIRGVIPRFVSHEPALFPVYR